MATSSPLAGLDPARPSGRLQSRMHSSRAKQLTRVGGHLQRLVGHALGLQELGDAVVLVLPHTSNRSSKLAFLSRRILEQMLETGWPQECSGVLLRCCCAIASHHITLPLYQRRHPAP